jgi:hypothetical protein
MSVGNRAKPVFFWFPYWEIHHLSALFNKYPLFTEIAAIKYLFRGYLFVDPVLRYNVDTGGGPALLVHQAGGREAEIETDYFTAQGK